MLTYGRTCEIYFLKTESVMRLLCKQLSIERKVGGGDRTAHQTQIKINCIKLIFFIFSFLRDLTTHTQGMAMISSWIS